MSGLLSARCWTGLRVGLLAQCLTLLCLTALVVCTSASTDPSWTTLTSDVPVPVSLAANSSSYFTFSTPAVSYTPTALLSIAASTGFPSVFVSLTASPLVSSSDFTYSASWQTGGVVSVTQQAPWTLYIALVSTVYSASNLTLLAVTYDPAVLQLSVIPLADAEPVASSIAAGQYRYFLYTCTSNSSVSIADTATLGQTAIVVSAVNAASLPTIYQYAFSTVNSPLQVVVVPSPSAGDNYTIGVWANVSSVFTLIAAAAQDVLPMQLGVTYPGLVQKGEQMYYSLYIDPLLLPTAQLLQLSLYSFTGDADLYCSNTTSRPSQRIFRWASTLFGPKDDIILPTAELYGGVYYCAVVGFAASSFSFTASFGSATILSSGLAQEVESPSAGQQLYSFLLPANSSATFVLINVVCETGRSALYAAPYPASAAVYAYWQNYRQQAVQSLQVPVAGLSSSVCGVKGGNVVPGSSPPVCQLSILVVTTQPAFYRISVSTGQVLPLLPGQQEEGAATAAQSSSFSFSVPDNLSNITLLVFVTSDATDVTLDVGPQLWPGSGLSRSTWTVQQQPGDDVLVFTLDWTDPLLPIPNQIRGSYDAVVSSQQNATFSILYTVMDVSGNAGSITQLIDGLPQPGQLQSGQYGFFYFSPPQFGWPYTVTISVVWLSGAGTLFVAQGDGTQPTPLPGESAIDSPNVAQFSPGIFPTCEANQTLPSGLPCGYSISLQAGSGTGPVQFTITATSSGFVRALYLSMDNGINPLPASASDLWLLSVSTWSVSSDNLLVLVTAQAGSLQVFISNSTVAPNASTAQWVLEATGLQLQDIPLSSGLRAAPIFFTVACTDSSDCLYSLSVTQVTGGSLPPRQQLHNASPLQGVLIAGGIGYYYLPVTRGAFAAFVLVSVVPQLGSATVYVGCVSTYRAAYVNETAYTWMAAGPGPVSVEISDLASANCTYLAVGVRAAAGSNAVFQVMAATAGVVQTLSSADVGYLMPQYNTSYYRYLMPDLDPTVVLSCVVSGSACLPQLHLLVSDTLSSPSAAAGLTANWSASLLQLSNGVQDLSIVLTNWSRPAGSLHAGWYLIAVRSSAAVSCSYTLRCVHSRQRLLQLGQTVSQTVGSSSITYFSYLAPADVAVSFGLSFGPTLGSLLLYLGVNSSPDLRDPSTYSLVLSFNSSLTSSYPPVYVPASLCPPSAAAALGGCALVFAAVTDASIWQRLGVTTASSAASVWLSPQQPYTVNSSGNSSAASSSFAFSLPAQPVTVTVTASASATSAPLNLACSASYVSPNTTFSDWSTDVNTSSFALANQSVALSFVWSSPQLNPNTALQAAAQTCYCSVLAWPGAGAYSISFSYVLLPEPSDSGNSGLSGGALYAAILVPVVVTVLLLAVLLVWLYIRRGGDCGDSQCCLQGKQRAFAKQCDGGSQDADSGSEAAMDAAGAVSMTQMPTSQQRLGDSHLMRGQQWYSER